MNDKKILEKVEKYVKAKCINDSSGHDWYHIERVRNLSLTINKAEKQNQFIILLIATLHDLFDHKFYDGDIFVAIKELFEELNIINYLTDEQVENIAYSCKNIGFTENKYENKKLSLEGQIVQDADRIDALGAIGIARTFATGAKFGNLLYDPENKNTKTTINHFYEKLFKLKDDMNTTTGKEIAIKRHKYMEDYLNDFYAEWQGIK